MAPRSKELVSLIAAEPGVARLFAPSEVRAILDDCMRNEQAAWSLLYYALWHAHHMLNIDSAGDIADVLSKAAECHLGPTPARAASQAVSA
jgi:asparagine synthase (glutamine-hydrolysing)